MSLFGELTSGVNAVRPSRTQMRNYDLPLVVSTTCLLLLGLVMVYSATVALPDSPKFSRYDNLHFLIRHAIYLILGVVAAAFVLTLRMNFWKKWAKPIFCVALVLLVAVLIPGIGREVNGASRWISLGLFNIQPSELMKLAVILYAADYTVRKQEHMLLFWRGFVPMMVAMGVTGLLLMAEPDLGALVVILSIAMGILFLGGINLRFFISLLVLLLGFFVLVIWLSPWRLERFFAYLDPWDQANALGKAYQLSHSLIAFGRGEWLGVGLGASVEKLHYLPEAHTDFILAVIGEELGLVGVLIVTTFFFVIVRRGFEIGRQAIAMDRDFSGLVAKGVVLWIGVQALINMGVNLGLLPTKGLTLPFMSFGGSGIIANMCGVALLMRIDYENRILMRGGRV